MLTDPSTGKPSTFGSIEREIEWCEWQGKDMMCCCEWQGNELDTKCPDLGDWSEVPHDELDALVNHGYWLSIYAAQLKERGLIDLDRDRLLSYIED